MPLAAADLLQPDGRVASSFFPDDDATALADRLDTYLTAAYADPRVVALTTDAEQDAAARQWAYYRAFEAVADRVFGEAASIELSDQGARQRLISQMEYWKGERDAALNTFDALAPTLVVSTTPARQGSVSVPITFVR